jgi:ABC-type glycerol-3-phosphate transport system permease component
MSDTSATLSRRARIPVFLVLLALALTIAWPVLYLASAAFRTNADYLRNPFGWPSPFTFDNFVNLWNNYGLGQALANSIFVVFTALLLTLAIASLAGYAMAKLPVPGARYINAAFVSVMLIPSQVLIIPIYLLLSDLGLVNEFAGLILVYLATGLPFSVFFLTLSFRSIDDTMLEAARIDGAGFFRTLGSIVVPVGRAGVATLAVLQFLAMWNELLFAYILLPDNTKQLVTPALANIGSKFFSDQPLIAAGLIITSLPPIILLAVASRYIMQGLAAGISR